MVERVTTPSSMNNAASLLVLIGPRGAGKSLVGAMVAERLGIDFVDTDELVEARAGCSIAALFHRGGEAAFRAVESHVISDLRADRPGVVATGGGAVLSPANRSRLRALGPRAWLTAAPEVLAERIAGSDRPSLTGGSPSDEIEAVVHQRAPIYRELATWTVDTSERRPEEVCDELEHLWRDLQDHHLR